MLIPFTLSTDKLLQTEYWQKHTYNNRTNHNRHKEKQRRLNQRNHHLQMTIKFGLVSSCKAYQLLVKSPTFFRYGDHLYHRGGKE